MDGNAWRGLKVDDVELQLCQEIILASIPVFEALLKHEHLFYAIDDRSVCVIKESGLLVKAMLKIG